ncbi:hypothetical protein MLD38_034209 [Melastoma candidum]|uniref:Uncharacterized protein n=1 Tax=Melastoma candidum TaxID=119954 RepID=A0ACB9MBI9_9MYRT|nr:hypothetical protein MLD38_034209 [Melastoma candidum]
MIVRRQMGIKAVGVFVLIVSLIFSSYAACLEEGNVLERGFSEESKDGMNLDVQIGENMVELLWIHCRAEVIRFREIVEDLDLCSSATPRYDSVGCYLDSESLSDENIWQLLDLLCPQLKRCLVDCLRKSSKSFSVSGEEGTSKSWHSIVISRLGSGSVSNRRYLAGNSGEAAAPAPPPGLGNPSLSPAAQFLPQPPASSASNPGDPSPLDPAPSPVDISYPPETTPAGNVNTTKSLNSTSTSNKKTHRTTVVLAVVITATVTFILAALLVICYSRTCRPGHAGRNDDSPLLNISLSDYSAGSQFKSYYGSPINEIKPGQESLYNGSVDKEKTSSLGGRYKMEPDGSSSLANKTSVGVHGRVSKFSAQAVDSNVSWQMPPLPLRPPPGRVSSHIGVLKPPPGRASPLPPEPPAPPKPSLGMGPSPPPPPPSSKPPDISTRPKAPAPPPPPVPSGNPPPPPPPGHGGVRPGAPPPPPPKIGGGPPRPPMAPGGLKQIKPAPVGQKASNGDEAEGEGDPPKAKLKPFFWDKVLANPEHSMVWHQIKSGSFQFNEEMIESLFGYAAADKNKTEKKNDSSSQDPSSQLHQIIDPRKAQNLAILLRALNVTIEEVCDALHEGNEMPTEFLQNLLRMAPTADEELKLRLYNGELSRLGPADRFLKALVDIPFAFKRIEALLFMCTLQEEVTIAKESFATLEVACEELRNSRLFLKLLEAVLKTGNRMNTGTFRGGAQAFKLDTLLKLSDVKGTDGKTTLLHFVVQEIIRSEGIRAARVARGSQSSSSMKSEDLHSDVPNESEEDYYQNLGLQVVAGLGLELENVKKAAAVDGDSLTGSVGKLGQWLAKTRQFLDSEMKNSEEESGFHQALKNFVQNAEVDLTWLLEEEKRIGALVKSTGNYFHGNAGKDEGLRLFVIVRDFLIMLDKVCKEVKDSSRKPARTQKKEDLTSQSSMPSTHQPPSPDTRQQHLFPAIVGRRVHGSSSSSSSEDET